MHRTNYSQLMLNYAQHMLNQSNYQVCVKYILSLSNCQTHVLPGFLGGLAQFPPHKANIALLTSWGHFYKPHGALWPFSLEVDIAT